MSLAKGPPSVVPLRPLLTYLRCQGINTPVGHRPKNVFGQIRAAEKAGNLSPEEHKKLEEQAATGAV